MLTVFYLVVAIVLLMVLVGMAYRGGDPAVLEPEPDRRLDRLAMTLDPDVMEGVILRARTEGASEIAVLNRLLRERLRQVDPPPDPGNPPRS